MNDLDTLIREFLIIPVDPDTHDLNAESNAIRAVLDLVRQMENASAMCSLYAELIQKEIAKALGIED